MSEQDAVMPTKGRVRHPRLVLLLGTCWVLCELGTLRIMWFAVRHPGRSAWIDHDTGEVWAVDRIVQDLPTGPFFMRSSFWSCVSYCLSLSFIPCPYPMPVMNPMPADAAGQDDVFVGRIRRDVSNPNGLVLWIVSDNLRKGAGPAARTPWLGLPAV